jgi:hypothetical protein
MAQQVGRQSAWSLGCYAVPWVIQLQARWLVIQHDPTDCSSIAWLIIKDGSAPTASHCSVIVP